MDARRSVRAPKPPRVRAKHRLGRCYELAGKGIFYGGGDRGWVLVHGIAWCGGHAWLQNGDWVYDAVKDKCFTAPQYVAEFQATPIRVYTRDEVFARSCEYGHWGPWHDPVAALIEYERKRGQIT